MWLALILFGFIAYFGARAYESGTVRDFLSELKRVWRTWGVPARCIMAAMLVLCAIDGRTKGESPLAGLYRLLFWGGDETWALLPSAENAAATSQANAVTADTVAAATNTAREVEDYVSTNRVCTFSFDWHSPNRLPASDRQNVIGRTVRVTPTNVNGRLCEDHYVSFNAAATTNPTVILIEYAVRADDGSVTRYSAQTITNSYPDMVTVNLQSGAHTCYWFRCEVPEAFTNGCVRDWNGEALFGSPEGSGKGFDILGTLVIDNGDDVWVGATTNMICGGITNEVKNGIILEAP